MKVGETVRWKWGGGVQHDVEGDGFKSKLQSKGQFDHTFDEAGDVRVQVHRPSDDDDGHRHRRG